MTPEGKVYFDGCRALVDEYAAVEARVRSLKNEVAGTVSVAAIYSVGLSDMSRYVAQFAHLYPKAKVRLGLSASSPGPGGRGDGGTSILAWFRTPRSGAISWPCRGVTSRWPSCVGLSIVWPG